MLVAAIKKYIEIKIPQFPKIKMFFSKVGYFT